MSERIRVTEAELKRHWFNGDAVGMVHDHQTETKVVQMCDGTEYETPFSELLEEGRPMSASRDTENALRCIRRIAGRSNRRPGTREALLAIVDQVESGYVLPDLAEYERGSDVGVVSADASDDLNYRLSVAWHLGYQRGLGDADLQHGAENPYGDPHASREG